MFLDSFPKQLDCAGRRQRGAQAFGYDSRRDPGDRHKRQRPGLSPLGSNRDCRR